MDNQNHNVLNDDRIGKLLLKFSLPAFLGLFVMTLYNVVDTIFIGRYVGSLGIAGLSIAFPVQMLILGVGQMIGVGGASVISRALGANNPQKAKKTLGNAISISIIVSIVITAVGIANSESLLRLMGASNDVLPYASDYTVIILIGTIAQIFALTLSSTVRAEGNARVPMISMIIGGVANIGLDAVFVINLGMGTQGAAIATVIGQVISVIYLLRYYYSGRSSLDLSFRNLRIVGEYIKEILAIGVASFVQFFATGISAVFINRVLGSYGGDIAISAYGIINRVAMFTIMPGMVIGQGLQPILGFNYGAKRYDRALKSIKISIIVATACNIVIFLVLHFLPEPIIRIFTTDSALVEMSVHVAKYVFLVVYVMGIGILGSLIFQSVGRVTQSLVTAIVRPLALILLVFTLPKLWQTDGVWLSFPIADAIAFALSLVLLINQIKSLKNTDSPQVVDVSK